MPRFALFTTLVAATALAACAPPGGDETPAAGPAPLLSARHFTIQREPASDFLLSPDGRRIAWTEPGLVHRQLKVRRFADGATRSYRARGNVRWTGDSRRLVYLGDTSGDENPHVYVIDADSNAEAVDLTPYSGVRAAIQQLDAGDARHILVTHNRRNRQLPDLYRLDLETHAEVLVARNPGDAVAAVTRDDGSLAGWQRSRETGRAAQRARALAAPADAAPAAPTTVRPLPRGIEPMLRIVARGPEKHLSWALSSRGRDRQALVLVHSGPGWEHVEYEDPDADVNAVAVSTLTRRPLFAVAQPGLPRIGWLDEAFKADLAPLVAGFGSAPHGVALLGTDRDESRLLVSLYDSTRNQTWLIDRTTRRHEKLADGVPMPLAAVLSPMQPVRLRARDGLTLTAFLTLPRGMPPKGLPMVLLVHGGPWAQTQWADPMRSEDAARAQFLVNRGYAVLQVDFRGSTGYGRQFANAAMGEFARRMQDDLDDAVDWTIGQGIADPARIAIMGLSYGGFAALTGITRTPRRFACGISVGGPTDLASLIESFPPYWKTDLSIWHDFVGDPRIAAERAEMTRRSPLTHAAAAERPVLLIHGERDVRVRADQSIRMAEALRRAGRPVRLVTIPDMGHNPSWWAHQYRVMRESETFLAGCLGGRSIGFDWADPLIAAWARLTR